MLDLVSDRLNYLTPTIKPIGYRDSPNPVAIARQIADRLAILLKLTKDKTERRYGDHALCQ